MEKWSNVLKNSKSDDWFLIGYLHRQRVQSYHRKSGGRLGAQISRQVEFWAGEKTG